MERRQVLGAIAAPCITVGGAAVLASFNSSVPAAVRPWLMTVGGISALVGLTALFGLLLTAKPNASLHGALRPGRGGNATVAGNGIAKGGAGGAIGGGDGGSAYVGGGGMALGGEAGQADRGGRNPIEANGGPNTQLPDGTWLWDYGRGGGPAVPIRLHPDVEISEAVAYAFFRQWGRRFDEAARRTNASVDDVLTLVNQSIAAGHISVWGRSGMEITLLDMVNVREGLDRASLLAGRGKIRARSGEFDEILVNRQQFEARWPRYFEQGEPFSDRGIDALWNWTPKT